MCRILESEFESAKPLGFPAVAQRAELTHELKPIADGFSAVSYSQQSRGLIWLP